MRALVLALMVLVVFAASAEATPWERWNEASLVPVPERAITVHEEPCPWTEMAVACALPHSAEVWLPERRRRIYFHEVGHVYDYDHLNGRERRRLRVALGLPREPWWDDDAPTPNAEVFATAYSVCALRRRVASRTLVEYEYGYRPAPWRHRKVCRLIRGSR